MKKRSLRPGWLFIPALLVGASYARAITSPGNFSASQTGYQEVPPVFTGASGSCGVKIKSDGTSASYELTYTGLSSAVTQAHIHLGPQPSNGGIIVFLCDNTAAAPTVVPTCLTSPATVTGTQTSADVNPPKGPRASNRPRDTTRSFRRPCGCDRTRGCLLQCSYKKLPCWRGPRLAPVISRTTHRSANRLR